MDAELFREGERWNTEPVRSLFPFDFPEQESSAFPSDLLVIAEIRKNISRTARQGDTVGGKDSDFFRDADVPFLKFRENGVSHDGKECEDAGRAWSFFQHLADAFPCAGKSFRQPLGGVNRLDSVLRKRVEDGVLPLLCDREGGIDPEESEVAVFGRNGFFDEVGHRGIVVGDDARAVQNIGFGLDHGDGELFRLEIPDPFASVDRAPEERAVEKLSADHFEVAF